MWRDMWASEERNDQLQPHLPQDRIILHLDIYGSLYDISNFQKKYWMKESISSATLPESHLPQPAAIDSQWPFWEEVSIPPQHIPRQPARPIHSYQPSTPL